MGTLGGNGITLLGKLKDHNKRVAIERYYKVIIT